ncbi:hypothetical protein [Nocardiopsis synnemataformans]|uniref:hypothetical protein n=1 Tax=Nocardiopsis synnemataformans TaxID=61305 RepID=UPI003EBD34FB
MFKKFRTAALLTAALATGSLALASPASAAAPVADYNGGYFTTYAGPIYLNAAGRCVDWMGRITGTQGGDEGTNCG